jgi:hypothetical protein
MSDGILAEMWPAPQKLIQERKGEERKGDKSNY